MLIKNFQAGTIQGALDLVKKEFGQQAVILKTDILKDKGLRLFSVTAAKDFEEVAAASANALSGVVTKPAVPATFPTVPSTPPPPPPTVANNASAGKGRLESAILDVMLPELLTGTTKQYYLALRLNEVESELALQICRRLQQSKKSGREEMANIINDVASNRAAFPTNERSIVFVGPCGAGKSSLLAKFAAELVFNRRQQVTLSTLDSFRPGAAQEVKSVADVLSIAQETDGAPTRKSRSSRGCHLIDTTGLVIGDQESYAELDESLQEIKNRYTVLALSLSTSWKNNRRFLEFCLPLGIDGIVLTQLDLAQSCGAVVNIAAQNYAPVIGISDSRLPTGKIAPFDAKQYLDKLIGDEND